MKKSCCFIFLISLSFVSCVENKDEDTGNPDKNKKSKNTLTVSSETINQIIKSVPPPVELLTLVKDAGSGYNKDLLNNTSSSESYSTPFSKAVNLGVYGADLGYINTYEKTYASVEYLSTVRSIAKDLDLGHFFDFETLKRLSSNKDKMDSIVYISTSSFEKMTNYLARQKRENISILMLVGGWVESIYLSAEVARETGSQSLMDRVGEQKVALDQISILLKLYKNDPSFSHLISDMDALKILFDGVKIAYEYREPVTKEINGVLTVENGTTSKVEMSKDLFDRIEQSISKIRTNLIKI